MLTVRDGREVVVCPWKDALCPYCIVCFSREEGRGRKASEVLRGELGKIKRGGWEGAPV